MLRIYFHQYGFSVSDPVSEEALYASAVFRKFVDIDLASNLDETRLGCKFVLLLVQMFVLRHMRPQ